MVKSKDKQNEVMSSDEQLTEDQKLWWKDLKSLKVDVFGFEGQELSKFAEPLNLSSDSLFLLVKFPAVSPALELALRSFKIKDPVSKIEYEKYSMKTEDKYVVVFPTKGKIAKSSNGEFFFKKQN